MNILIVDDSPSMRKIVARALQTVPEIRVFEAGNGEEALVVLQEQLFMEDAIQVLILDWMMPKTTGFQLLKEIRKVRAFDSFPKIVMLSAETTSEQINACLQYNIETYIVKPFTHEQLLDAVNNALVGEEKRHAV